MPKTIAIKKNRTDAAARTELENHVDNLGYALLLKRQRADVENATDAEIRTAAESTVPNVPVLFWSFRIMVGLGFWFIALFTVAFWFSFISETVSVGTTT